MSDHLTDDELNCLTTDQLCAKLNELRQQSVAGVVVGSGALEASRKKEIIEMLHDFNDLKDAAQIVLGALANMQGITIKEMHMAYNLPLKD